MLKYFLLVISLFIISGCSSTENSSEEIAEKLADEKIVDEIIAEYQKISAEEAKDLMVEGNLILDVRTQEEFDQGYIEGAILLPVDSILAGQLESLPDKNQTILVYCRSGNRSAIASKALVEAGYTQVYDFGGINDWPYEIVVD